MDHASQIEVIARWLDLHDRGETQLVDDVMPVDVSFYLSDAWFAREHHALFREGVVVACLGADVRESGDHIVIESGGIPLVVVRDGDGVVRGFVNACRHRGSPVVAACGVGARNFACPFHSWTYALDGRLLGQPRSEGGFSSLDRDDYGLLTVPVAEAHGLVLVRPGGDAPIDAEAELHGVGADLDAFHLGSYHVHGRMSRTWQCNWKLLLDTFMESYHVFSLHGASVGPDYPGHIMVFDAYGPHLRIPVPRSSILGLASAPRDEWSLLPHATVQWHLAPNAMINHTIDHVILWRFVPTAVDQTVAEMTMYVPHQVDDDDERKVMDDWFDLHDSVTRDEDYPQSEHIHSVLSSGSVTTNVLGRNEGAVQHFHRSVRAAVEARS